MPDLYENGRMRQAADRIETLEEALRFGTGCAINELVAAGKTTEWGPTSGIGTMLKALGCNSTHLDAAVRITLNPGMTDSSKPKGRSDDA